MKSLVFKNWGSEITSNKNFSVAAEQFKAKLSQLKILITFCHLLHVDNVSNFDLHATY